MRSPKIITDSKAMEKASVITSEDISCLVIPDKMHWTANYSST